jgi:hypothetical protein
MENWLFGPHGGPGKEVNQSDEDRKSIEDQAGLNNITQAP